MSGDATQHKTMFENPFRIEDLLVFDDDTLCRILQGTDFALTQEQLAHSFHGASEQLVKRIKHILPEEHRAYFLHAFQRSFPLKEVEYARKQVLDGLFWELTYWKTPGLYEELTAGEHLHPGIFQRLASDIHAKTVLDAGAGTGRATFEALQHGADRVYAVEPSPGLLRILKQKIADRPEKDHVILKAGRFDALPLEDNSVDLALSCSAFTAMPAQGGEAGLAELTRVTKPGGKVVIIWPRVEDYDWLEAHGFQHVVLPMQQDMCVHFRSLQSTLRCVRRFYAHNQAVVRYVLAKRKPELPFSVIGVNPPRDYCWLEVHGSDGSSHL